MRTASAIGLALLLVLPAPAASALQKDKDKDKDKAKKEKRFEPIENLDVDKLGGRYVGIDATYFLEIAVGENGQLQIMSVEGPRRAKLTGVHLDGPNLTATRAYDDGTTAKFDGLFVDRILNGERAFGVLVSGIRIELDGLSLERVFYRFTGPGE